MRLALAAVAALSVFAAGCGGVEGEPNLAKAVKRTEATGSFAMEMTARGTERGEQVSMDCDGAIDHSRKRARMACTGDPLSTFEMVTVGETTYVKGWNPEDPASWAKFSDDDEDAFQEFSPESLLGLLRSASEVTERVGEEEVRRERTVRYALTVDCERAEIVDCDGKTAVVDVWIDDDGLVRRIRMDQRGVLVNVEFFDFGIPVDVEPPPADQIAEFPDPDPPAPCAAEDAKPIRVDQAIQALRRHGFDVSRDEAGCAGSVAAILTNFPADGSNEALLSCFVLTTRTDASPPVVTATSVGGADRQEVRVLENIECSLFDDGATVDEALARLDDALAELKQAIRP